MADKGKNICYEVFVLGAGGTGTYFLKEAGRLVSSDPEIKKRIASMYIVDGDSVEEKNLSRQCFTADDIGRNKAVVMSEVLNETFGLSTQAVPRYVTESSQIGKYLSFTEKWITIGRRNYIKVPLIISCVDNHAARLCCEDFFANAETCICFDSANEFDTGECVFAYKVRNRVIGPCRSHYFPEIKKGDLRNVTEMSCEELNQSQPQHIFTNMMAGLQLCAGFSNLLDGRMSPGFTFFNPVIFQNEFISYKSGASSECAG